MTTDMYESDVPRANFYGAIDVISQAIKNRFDQDDFRQLISNCLIGAANKIYIYIYILDKNLRNKTTDLIL